MFILSTLKHRFKFTKMWHILNNLKKKILWGNEKKMQLPNHFCFVFNTYVCTKMNMFCP